MKTLLLSAACLAAFAGTAHAIEEVRFGVAHHNIRTDHGQLADPKEDGPNIEAELVFHSPAILEILGSPRPYVMVSVNTHGNTSFAGFGGYWRWEFADGWAFEPGFGYVMHNGAIDNIYTGTSPEGIAYERAHQLLGSRDLFRTSFALEREFGNRFATQLYYEHMSHGQILNKGRNQGLDEAGLRFIVRFNPDPAIDGDEND